MMMMMVMMMMMMMMMRRLSSLRVRAKPRHLAYIYIIYILICNMYVSIYECDVVNLKSHSSKPLLSPWHSPSHGAAQCASMRFTRTPETLVSQVGPLFVDTVGALRKKTPPESFLKMELNDFIL